MIARMDGTAARLVAPSAEYKRSFIDAVKEFQADRYPMNSGGAGRYREVDVADLERDFDGYLAALADFAAGRNLKPGYVPESTYWLIHGNEFIGRASVRHRLNDDLTRTGGHIGYDIRPSRRRLGYGMCALALALKKAKELGLTRVLLTTDSINAPSRKIIEANGGVFEDEVPQADGKPPKQRFWIDLA